MESGDVFLIFKPKSRLCRDDFRDHRPQLRQALVAACAATETYLADTVLENVSRYTRGPKVMTPRLKKVPLDVGDWIEIETSYKYRRRGIHEKVIGPWVREQASTDPAKVGMMLSLIGIKDWSKKLDRNRGVAEGATERLLRRITSRRNKIAHEGDRQGRGRAALDIKAVKRDLKELESVAAAVEQVVRA
jgi:hypothetical protein